ncbi:hypothetical protein WDU94_011741 [Cyamophila willieti]
MKCTIPEISWHNRDPVLSVDIQRKQEKDIFYRVVTGGADSHVFIWYLTEGESGVANVEFASDLSRHQKAVNVVRFSPDGQLLASGDDESVIFVWKQRTDQDPTEFPSGNLDEENVNKEHWLVTKILRGHLEDVYDIAWSPTSDHLISGSVDNTAILWNVHKGKNLGILSEHKKFVQGVAWDPKNQYVATLSSDRSLRTYSIASKKVISRATRSKLPLNPSHELFDKVTPLFHDDTMKSFFRRLDFSPDGNLLVAPSGVLETSGKHTSVTHVFTRACLNKPAVCLPSLQYYSVAVKVCPVLFELKPSDTGDDALPLFKLPYRMVIAVATENNILLYDTQHATPFAFIANIHYTKLTDITWSRDGRVLIASSTDGYCSIISFGENEIGTLYIPSSAGAGDKENVNPSSENKDKTTGIGEKGITSKTPNCDKRVNNDSGEVSSKSNVETGNTQQTNKKTNQYVDKTEKFAQKDGVKDSKKVLAYRQNDNKLDVKSDSTVSEIICENKTDVKNNTDVPDVEIMEVDLKTEPNDSTKERECPRTPNTPNKATVGTPNKGRRVQLITLSSPNRKRKLDEEKIKQTIQENDSKKFHEHIEQEVISDVKDSSNTVETDVNMKDLEEYKEQINSKEENKEKIVETKEVTRNERKGRNKEEIQEKAKKDSKENGKELENGLVDTETSTSDGKKSDLHSILQDSPCNKPTPSPTNCKSVDFDLILENTGDSIINPSFIDDSPKSAKGAKGSKSTSGVACTTDFSKLSDTLAKLGDSGKIVKNSEKPSTTFTEKMSDRTDKLSPLDPPVCEDKSDASNSLQSPSREKNTGTKHVFTPPRSVASPNRGATPGRRVQLITLSSPKVKSKTQDK